MKTGFITLTEAKLGAVKEKADGTPYIPCDITLECGVTMITFLEPANFDEKIPLYFDCGTCEHQFLCRYDD